MRKKNVQTGRSHVGNWFNIPSQPNTIHLTAFRVFVYSVRAFLLLFSLFSISVYPPCCVHSLSVHDACLAVFRTTIAESVQQVEWSVKENHWCHVSRIHSYDCCAAMWINIEYTWVKLCGIRFELFCSANLKNLWKGEIL